MSNAHSFFWDFLLAAATVFMDLYLMKLYLWQWLLLSEDVLVIWIGFRKDFFKNQLGRIYCLDCIQTQSLDLTLSSTPSQAYSHVHLLILTMTTLNIKFQQCPLVLYIAQTSQTLQERINGHTFDIKNQKTEKPVGEDFKLPGHSMGDSKVAVLFQRNFRNRLEREMTELKVITALRITESPGLNRDIRFFYLPTYANLIQLLYLYFHQSPRRAICPLYFVI